MRSKLSNFVMGASHSIRLQALLAIVLGTLAANLISSPVFAQTTDLTVDVLVNSGNTTGYNTNPSTPGDYQLYVERYLEDLQMPYRVIDVSTTPPPSGLTQVPLIIAAHNGLQLSSAWQQAILSAVEGGVGFVNFDADPAICTYAHMQSIFGCASSATGTEGNTITLLAPFLFDGATPHYIMQNQLRFPLGQTNTASGAISYIMHEDANNNQANITSTVLLNAAGQPVTGNTVLAKIGNDAFLSVNTFGSGHAANFGTYGYLSANAGGFNYGLDDLFWRSLVWTARKPFVIRGYPRFFASQMDDPDDGVAALIGDLFNPSLTGAGSQVTLPNGTVLTIGGPWRVDLNIQTDGADFNSGTQTRQQMIAFCTNGYLVCTPHTVTGGENGDLFWTGPNSTGQPLTDSQWLANYNALLQFQQGAGPNGSFNGGSDFLPFGQYMIPHFWDFSNNIGYDMWQLGVRYITEIQPPNVFYAESGCKTNTQRMLGLHPFFVYQIPPNNCNPNEQFSFFWADNYTIGSRAGHPSETFFGITSQLQTNYYNGPGYPSFDAAWPASVDGVSEAIALENWQAYTWRFWSAMLPVQIYNHEAGKFTDATEAERQFNIKNVSAWVSSKGGIPITMEGLGAYAHARVNSNLTGGSVTPSTITLNYGGSATDMNGNPVTTMAYIFFNDDNGTLVDVPGFTNGTTASFPNVTPPTLAVNVDSLSYEAVINSSNPPAQNISVSNSGTGTVNWTASSNASWLTLSPASGTNAGTIQASVNISGLAGGTYNATITVSASGANGSPQLIGVTLLVSSPILSVSPTSVSLNGFSGGGNPSPVTLNITNPGAGVVNWNATVSPANSWLSLSSSSGTAPSTTNVQANISGLSAGTYSGSVTINAPGAENAPQTIPVTLNVSGLLMSSTSTLQGWANSPLGLAQDWSIVNGAIQNNGGGHTQLYAGDGNWANYDLKTDIKLASLSDYPGGIRARVNPTSGASYTLWLYPNEGIVRLYRTVGWNIDSGFTQLGQAAFANDATKFHTYELNCSGTTIQALVDGNLLIQATDSTLASGMVALDVSNRVINFQNILVTSSTQSSDAISSTQTSFSFATVNGANPAAQALQLSSSGGELAWTASSSASWLTFSANSGNTGGSVNVSANANGLAPGNYNATITITSLGGQGSPLSIPVTFNVTALEAVLQSTPAALNFFGSTTLAPAGQNINISNGASGAMSWSASADSGWLSTNPSAGNAPTTATVTANSVGMAVGQYNGNVILSSTQAGNSPLNVPVSLYVGTLLFSDNFSDGSSSSWTISPQGNANGWSVANGFYAYDGQGPTQSYTGQQSWTNYSFSTDFQLSSTSNYPGGIRARLNLTTGSGYGVWFYPGSGFIRLYSIRQWNIDSGFSTLAQANMTFDTKVHNVRIDVNGSLITVFYDNAQIIQVTDATYSTGGVALDVSSQPIKYTNVRVTSF